MSEKTDRLKKSMSMAELAATDMREAGLTAQEISIGFAFELQRQARLAMQTEAAARMWLEALIT